MAELGSSYHRYAEKRGETDTQMSSPVSLSVHFEPQLTTQRLALTVKGIVTP